MHILHFRKKKKFHFFHFFLKKIFLFPQCKFTKKWVKKQQKKCKKAMLFFRKFVTNFGQFRPLFLHFFAPCAHEFLPRLSNFYTTFSRPKKSVQNFKILTVFGPKKSELFLTNFFQIFRRFSENTHRKRRKFPKNFRKNFVQNFPKISENFKFCANLKFKICTFLHIFAQGQKSVIANVKSLKLHDVFLSFRKNLKFFANFRKFSQF